MSKPEIYASVWDAIADTPEEAANLRARAKLMQKIAALLKEHDWAQAEAPSRCGVTQPRINDLLRAGFRAFRWTRWSTLRLHWVAGCVSILRRPEPGFSRKARWALLVVER